jgi:hypothetical protein
MDDMKDSDMTLGEMINTAGQHSQATLGPLYMKRVMDLMDKHSKNAQVIIRESHEHNDRDFAYAQGWVLSLVQLTLRAAVRFLMHFGVCVIDPRLWIREIVNVAIEEYAEDTGFGELTVVTAGKLRKGMEVNPSRILLCRNEDGDWATCIQVVPGSGDQPYVTRGAIYESEADARSAYELRSEDHARGRAEYSGVN